jgi:hypothetical protein
MKELPGFNSLQQQERFDSFVREFNAARSPRHEMLGRTLHGLNTPLRWTAGSGRPFHDRDVLVTACGATRVPLQARA